MRFISGPPRDIVFGIAQDFAEVAMDIYRLPDLDDAEREQAVAALKAKGAPTTLPDLVEMAAATIARHHMGWYRRNQFLGGLQAFCCLSGMPRADAAHLTGLIKTRGR